MYSAERHACRARRTARTVLSCFIGCVCVLMSRAAAGAEEPELDGLLRDYFNAKAPSVEQDLREKIVAIDGLNAEKLAAAIRSVNLWSEQKTGVYNMSIRLRRGKSSEIPVWLSVPAGYETGKRWPLVVTFHGQGQPAENMLRLTRQWLGERAGEFILAAPQDFQPLDFNAPGHFNAQPRYLVAALRRVFRLDSDRVYVMGYSLGGHRTWMTLISHADVFAGAVPMATPLQLVGGDALWPIVLPNARHVPILFCWGEKDTVDERGQPRADGGNTGWNRRLRRVIEGLDFSRFEAFEQPDVGHVGVVPPREAFDSLLNQERAEFPRSVEQVFRLPHQSRAYWVETDDIHGQLLSVGTIRVAVEPGEDPLAAQRRYFREHLSRIVAESDGRTIRLETHKTRLSILLLSDAIVDLDRPIRIFRNGRERFRGRVRRDPDVMLREAATEWDFDRLYTVRMVVPVGGKVRLGYPEEREDD